jgi:putative flippase GtrA
MSNAKQGLHDWFMRHYRNSKFRFLFVGGTTAGIYLIGVYSFLALQITSWMSALLAYSLSFFVGYLAHKFFTFQSKSSHALNLPRYALLQSICAIVSATSAIGAETLFQTRPLLIALITTTFLGIASYLISSRWVFSK